MRVGKVVGGVIGDLSVRVKLTGVVVGTDGGGCHHEAPLAAGENSPVAPFFVTDCRFSLGGGTSSTVILGCMTAVAGAWHGSVTQRQPCANGEGQALKQSDGKGIFPSR
jgi:hypothetical protein